MEFRQDILLTVDVLLFSLLEEQLQVLLIERKHPPFQGHWALPGGFVETTEPLESAARRELKEETGIERLLLQQLHTFGRPGRDPRGRTVSVVYLGLAASRLLNMQAGDDAAKAKLISMTQLPPLAFDHDEIVGWGYNHLQRLAADLAQWQQLPLVPTYFDKQEADALRNALQQG